MNRSALIALSLTGLGLAAAPAIAQAPAAPAAPRPPAAPRLAGTVTAIGEDSITVKAADGTSTTMPLSRTWTAVNVRPVSPDMVKPGSFVATANLAQGDGVGKSIEIRLFEPGNKGGEGSRPMAQAGQIMTNATVTKAAKTANGLELDVTYPGGVRHIIVPPDVQIMGSIPTDRDTVKPGAMITANSAAGDDGVFRVTRIAVAAPKA